MILKNYQEESICKLKCAFENCFNSESNDICVFQAPTGSGKTVTCAHLLKIIIQERISPKPLSFIWVSVRKLHIQSKDKLIRIYQDSQILECSEFNDLQENVIQENEIWFVNWESINKINNNIIIQENEDEKYLKKIIENTKQEGRNVVLIIDESHHTANSERSLELINIIEPKLTMEISATPTLKENCTALVKTRIDDVKHEEMIKNQVLINSKIDKNVINNQSATSLVIKHSIKKQKQLKELYKKEGVSINPLILVQLPDRRAGILDKTEEIISEYEKYGKTVDKNNLAIWMSETKSNNLEGIVDNDNVIDVLLFKQAIALGWDCPRAAILVIFRETKNLDFTIQILGRIMRMPEQKHYVNNLELNYGYVFTNLEKINLVEEYVKDYASKYHLERNDKLYDIVELPSTYLKRQRERTRLSGKFTKLFTIAAKENDLENEIRKNPTIEKIIRPIIVDGIIENIDKSISIVGKNNLELSISESEIQRLFDLFILDACKPFAPFDSGDRLKTALYNWLYDKFRIEKFSALAQINILAEKNIELFLSTIQLAKEKYKKDVINNISNIRDHIEINPWEIPIEQSITSAENNYINSIMNPQYVQIASEVERKFIDKLDKSDNVKWWYKNGQNEIKYFAIPYVDEFGLEWSFYIDFIIRFKDGTIGIFDTKSGNTANNAKYKAEALAKYIKKHTTKNRPLIGGIIVPIDYGWRYNDNDIYEYNPNDLSNWKILNL